MGNARKNQLKIILALSRPPSDSVPVMNQNTMNGQGDSALEALQDLLDQLESVGLYIKGEEEGQWHGAEGLSFSRAEKVATGNCF
jgi:hypothetical protein